MAKTEVSGSIAHGVVANASFPVEIGGISSSALPTAVEGGDAVRAWFDVHGRMGTLDGGQAFTSKFNYTASADMQTAAALTDAPTSGQHIVVDNIWFSTDTAMNFEFEEETSATVLVKVYLPANGYFQYTPRGKLKLPTADKKVFGDANRANSRGTSRVRGLRLRPPLLE